MKNLFALPRQLFSALTGIAALFLLSPAPTQGMPRSTLGPLKAFSTSPNANPDIVQRLGPPGNEGIYSLTVYATALAPKHPSAYGQPLSRRVAFR